ncbi:MAG: hypothetical protein MUE49_10930 [Rhodospirillales bacterium]|jgi:hypothetical protein|nr:hypothetical protein [Rhodospirillales bacterium]
MSVVVAYPVEVKSYQVTVRRNVAEIALEGVEVPEEGAGASEGKLRRVGRMTFGNPNPVGDDDFISRGGFLQMDRPLEMFSGVLDILRNERPLFLRQDGTLSTSKEPVGEGEPA